MGDALRIALSNLLDRYEYTAVLLQLATMLDGDERPDCADTLRQVADKVRDL